MLLIKQNKTIQRQRIVCNLRKLILHKNNNLISLRRNHKHLNLIRIPTNQDILKEVIHRKTIYDTLKHKQIVHQQNKLLRLIVKCFQKEN